jgi:hypothetical protein
MRNLSIELGVVKISCQIQGFQSCFSGTPFVAQAAYIPGGRDVA